MAKTRRDFRMSYADLAMFVSNLVVVLTRDVTLMSARGVTQVEIDALEALGNAFEVFPTDEYYSGQVMTAVHEKDDLRAAVTLNIQYVSGFIEQKWGLDSGIYKQLKIHRLQSSSDNLFIVSARQVALVAEDNLATLGPLGLLQTDIDALRANAQLFEDKLNDIREKKLLRDDKAEERTVKANELYGYVAEYCKIGKIVFQNLSESKYNDYVIHKTYHAPPLQVTGLAYDTNTGTLSWDNLPDIWSYHAEYAPDQPAPIYIEFWSGEETSVVYDPGGPLSYLFRVRAKGIGGYGAYSEVLVVPRP